jgi:hypothetical protein
MENGTNLVAALEAANLATAWHIVLTSNFIFALSLGYPRMERIQMAAAPTIP